MYLSKIEIFGFKSFAQNVNLIFDSGITAIVGPNGCGKTNIVDAIRWALGEQRYSTLRSDKMEDVIFNGTKNRKPLSMAEVSLVIENTKGILPTDYSQVTITRRVYRSGESEYLLNKVPCRLKDILDLFMDTGMGADAYSVIELKMVETILSDKTDERRRLFEEAAGVTKYKHRRKAAYRKLESVQQDLVRVNDIVKEVQKNVNALERQSKRAEQYNEISQNLRVLEIDLLEHEYAYLYGKLIPLKERLDQVNTSKTKIDNELAEHEELLDRMRIAISEVERKLIETQSELAGLISRKHKLDESIIIGNERRSSLTSNIERYEKEKVELSLQKDKLDERKVILIQQIETLSVDVANATDDYNRTAAKFQSLKSILEGKKSEVQKYNDEIITLIHEIVQKSGEKNILEERVENLDRRAASINEDIVYFKNEINSCTEKVTTMTVQDKELHRQFVQAEMELVQINSAVAQIKSEIENIQQQELDLKNEIHRITAKIDFQTGLIKGYEGRDEATKFLLSGSYQAATKFITVADVINTEEKYRTAIQAALGEAANYLIVEKETDGYAAISELDKQGKGKALFFCLDRVPKIRRTKNLPGSSLTWATQVVKVKEPYRELINLLLDNVIIVEKITSIPNSMIGVKYVALNGNIKTSSGTLRGGSQRQDEGGLIGLRDQIEELESDKSKILQELEKINSLHVQKLKSLEEIDIKAATDKVKNLEREMTAIEMKIAQVEFEKKRAHDSLERINAEVVGIAEERAELSKEVELLFPQLEAMEKSKSELEEKASALHVELENLNRLWGELSKKVNDAEIKLVTIQGDQRNADLELKRVGATIAGIESTLSKREDEVISAKNDVARISTNLELYNERLLELKSILNDVEFKKKEIESEYTEKRNAIHSVELKIKDDRRIHDDNLKLLHDVDIKISEINSNTQHLKERAQNEFELELILKTYPEDEWVDFAAKREEVRQIKERIRMLGAINFAAFDEFQSESERLNFLTQQRDDLLEAERTLLSTIEEINNTAQRKFLETFEAIRDNFIKTFKSLFDEGDECDLRLEEGVDPLEAGIEIIAKPRGKRPTSIDLLSGGEKTLTAIALLFAIYLVKPSPFCILDEVDAPLDDSNIDRYTRILHKFSDNTQFIVVTHNKRTMEAAHALYGVTMEEEGISKIVTVRFNEEARVISATIASGV